MATNEIEHKERVHAPFGGSVAARRIACTASYAAESQIPDEESSEIADDGTRFHECCEWGLANFLYYKVHGEYTDLKKPSCYNDYQENVDLYVKTVWEQVLFQTVTGKLYAIESKLVLNESLGMSGSADLVVIYNDERGRPIGVIGDIKWGFNFVEADKNDQLSFYAVALQEQAIKIGKELHAVRAFIYQPRVEGATYRETLFSAKYLETWKKKAYKAAESIFITKKIKFKAGDWCKWCKARSVCPAFLKERQRESQLQLVDYQTVELPKVELLPPEHVRQLVLHGDKLEKLVKDAKALAINMCTKQGEWGGLKLVEGKGKRSWIENEEEVVGVLQTHKVDPYKKSLIGITDAQGLIAKSAGSKEIAFEIMTAITKTSEPKILVDVSDPREAIKGSVEMLTKLE